MGIIDSILLSLAVSHLTLVSIFILLHYRKHEVGQLLALLCICLISYLLGSAPGEYFNYTVSDYIYRRIGNLSPILLWLISHKLFIDRHGIHPIVWILTAAYLFLRSIGAIYLLNNTSYDLLIIIITYVLPQIIMIGFVIHSLYIAIGGFDSDLIIERREGRIAFVASSAGLLLLIAVNTSYLISSLVLSSLDNYSSYSLLISQRIYSGYTYLAVSALIFWRIRMPASYIPITNSKNKKLTNSVSGTAKIQKQETDLIEKIKSSMEDGKIYLKDNLTVKHLATHVSSQEYKVRKVINHHLGYRNFSDFLNHYRSTEAARRLIETEESVSNIGWEVGYSSLSAYHKAFKEQYGCTPKEFRIRSAISTE